MPTNFRVVLLAVPLNVKRVCFVSKLVKLHFTNIIFIISSWNFMNFYCSRNFWWRFDILRLCHDFVFGQVNVTYVISSLSKTFLSYSFSLSVNSFFGLPAFDWVGLMRSSNLFANAEMTSLLFLALFGSVFPTFWMLLDLMWACEKAESSLCFIARFAAVTVAILSLTRCCYFCFFISLNS